jgi:putative ABC transport system permease protein
MLKNYFKIALRNLWRHRVFSLINVLGLTVGMTACYLIFLFVHFELTYDAFNTKADRIFRVVADIKTPTETIHSSGPSWAVGPHITAEFPEIEASVRISNESFLIRRGDVKFQEEHSAFADSSLFQVFDFKMIHGNPKTALKEPLSIVFTQTAAKKYFGDKDPVGQMVIFTIEGLPAKITGIIQDIPENSQIKADMFVSMSTLTTRWDNDRDNEWGNYGANLYLLLKPHTNPTALQAKFPAFLEKRNGDEMRKFKMYASLYLEPLRYVYLHSTRNGSTTGNIKNVYIFSIVAAFILFIACINFVNLTTARSTERAKEVGIRKVVGALRPQLARQFISESVLLCLMAFMVSLGVVALLIPLFNELAGKKVSQGLFEFPSFVGILLLAAVVIGSLAGLYPAAVLSAFRPVTVLKGRFSSGAKGAALRKALVIAQFTISIAFIIGTLIVYSQLNFMRSQDLGFNKDQMLVIETNGGPNIYPFQHAVNVIPGVISTSMTSGIPGGNYNGAYSVIQNYKGEMQIANLDLYFVDWNFIPQYQLKMVAGRPFSQDFQTDTTQAIILNEAAVKMFGYPSPRQAIGRDFSQWGRQGKIIGVMKDWHYKSLQKEITPLSMRVEPQGCNVLSAKVSTANLPTTIAAIERKWKQLIPERPFNYYFLDNYFNNLYRDEDRFGKLFINFAVLAIFISCLGLLGLASYSTMQRTKEIGIRKVLGASVGGIVNLLSKDFLLLVGISFVIAVPVAYYFMHRWLQDFAYRVPIAWWIFVSAGVMAVIVALLTVSTQAIRAAVANPVESLRTE